MDARSFQTFKMVYTVGKLGIDDTGGIQIAFRRIGDMGRPQTTQPTAASYTTATSNSEGRIDVVIGFTGMKPWNLLVTAHQSGGYLTEGEQIEIIFGDTSKGSSGMLMQTFVESGCEFRVMSDVQATGNILPLPEQLWVPIVAAPV